GPCDRLADPPGGVGRELEATRVVELLDRVHEARIALLDEVEQLQTPVLVALGEIYDETQVRTHHLLHGPSSVALDPGQFPCLTTPHIVWVWSRPRLPRQQTRLDPSCQLDLFLRGEQCVPPDGGEVLPHPVGHPLAAEYFG